MSAAPVLPRAHGLQRTLRGKQVCAIVQGKHKLDYTKLQAASFLLELLHK